MIFKKIKFTTSTIIIFIVLPPSANVIIGTLLANCARAKMRELINGRMLSLAETAGAMLDSDVLYSLSEEDVGTEKQNEVLDILDSFRENMDFEYIYIVRPCNVGTYVFIADADPIEPAEFGKVIVESPALYSEENGKATVDTIAVGDH